MVTTAISVQATLLRLKNISVCEIIPESLALLHSGQDSFIGLHLGTDPFCTHKASYTQYTV